MSADGHEEFVDPVLDGSPMHGDQGDRSEGMPKPDYPRSVTVAISREAGARGGSIGQRVGTRLGWQVYRQDLLEFIAAESTIRQDIADNLSDEASKWVEEHLDRLAKAQVVSPNPTVIDMARIVLSLAAHGEAVLLGQGAGCVLPPESTLNVRLVCPLDERIAYMSQWLRLTEEQAAEQVAARDRHRVEFVETYFHRSPSDVYQYDLVLNSSLLGEELATDLIVQAIHTKLDRM